MTRNDIERTIFEMHGEAVLMDDVKSVLDALTAPMLKAILEDLEVHGRAE